MRRRPVPHRGVGGQVVVARPADGVATALNATTALVWFLLDDWRGVDDLEDLLSDHYPEVPRTERRDGLSKALTLLFDEDLVERLEP